MTSNIIPTRKQFMQIRRQSLEEFKEPLFRFILEEMSNAVENIVYIDLAEKGRELTNNKSLLDPMTVMVWEELKSKGYVTEKISPYAIKIYMNKSPTEGDEK